MISFAPMLAEFHLRKSSCFSWLRKHKRGFQTLAEVVVGVESGDHAAVEPALLSEVDGAQAGLGITQPGQFDPPLDLRVAAGIGVPVPCGMDVDAI